MPELRDARARQRDHAHRLLRELEARVLPVVQKALDRVADGFARQVLHDRETLVAQGGEPIDPLDLTTLAALWGVEVPAILAVLRAVYEASELETVRRFGGQRLADAVTRDPDHPLARSLAQRVDDYLEVAGTRITAVGDTLVDAARTALAEGNAAGDSADQVAQRLREAFARYGQQLGDVRAEIIARTEVQGAWENASRDSARALPEEVRPRYKTWLATLDQHVRDSHFQVDGVTIELDAQFEVGGVLMDGPHDPAAPPEETIRCRCDLAFGDDPDDVPALGIDRQYKDDEAIQRVLDIYEERGITRDADTTASASTLTRSAAGSGPGSRTRRAAMPDPLPPLLAAAASHTGAMIALVPSEEDAARLAVDGGEPVEQLHVTLMYLGQADDIPQAARDTILAEAAAVGRQRGPRQGDAFAIEVFNPGDANDKNTAIVLGLSGEQLAELHLAAIAAAGAAGSDEWSTPEQYQPWAPHITLAYTDDLHLVEQLVDRIGPVTFDRIRVAFAGQNTDIPLKGTTVPEPDVTAADGRPTRRWSTPPPTALAFLNTETGDGRLFTDEALYWDGNGPWPLEHADERLGGHDGAELAGAIDHLAIDQPRLTGDGPLYVDVEAGTKAVDLLERNAPLGVSVDLDNVDLEIVDTRPPEQREADAILASFTGLSASVLSLESGGWRVHAPGLRQSITAAGIDLTASAGITAAAGDPDDPDGEVLFVEHAGDILMRITRARVRGATLVSVPAFADARIVLDETEGGIGPMVTPAEAQAQVGELMAEILDYVASTAAPVRPGQVAEQLGITGQTARTYLARAVASGRLARPARGLYTTSQPAPVSAAAVGNVELPIHDDRDRDWDGQEAASRVLDWANAQAEGTDDPPAQWLRQAFLYEDEDANQNTLSAYRLGFADVIDDELRIVARGVFATAGGRGVDAADIPEDEKELIRDRICRLYERLAEAFDEDLVCPWQRDETAAADPMVASAWSEFQALPPLPAVWFAEPTPEELPPDSGGVHVTDEGRIYGWVAQRGVPHDGFPGRQLTLDDLEPVDLSHFLRSRFRLDNGQTVRAGAFTMNVGHHRDGAECETSACQFDDTRTVAGIVTVGLNDRGMWFSGAAAPWLSEWDLAVFAACQPSYHMTANPDGRGYSLRAVLSVPRPGHPSRLAASAMVDRSNLALTPAGVRPSPATLTAAAPPPLDYAALAVAVVDEQERRAQARAEAEVMRAEMEAMQAELARAQVAAMKAEIEGGA